ncbi:hypothetical protein [Paenibacillus marinisediminis]
MTNLTRLRLDSDFTFPALPTADGSGQTVHPSVRYFPEGWNGYKYWMAVSGYKNGIATYENTHIFVSNDLTTWSAPPSFTNPLDVAVLGDYESDPYLLYKSGVLYVYYRDGSTLLRRSTTDGSTWTPRELCTSNEVVVSPSVLYMNGRWYMWAGQQDQGGGLYVYESDDGIHWGSGRKCRTNVRLNLTIWHCEVWRDGGLYHVLASAGTSGYNTLQTTQLYYGTSLDGDNWILDEMPCVPKDICPELAWRIYKSCPVPHGDRLLLFVSGGDKAGGTQLTGMAWTTLSALPVPAYPMIDEKWISDYSTISPGEMRNYGWFKPSPYRRLRGVVKLEHAGELVIRQGVDASNAYSTVETISLSAAEQRLVDIELILPWVNVSLRNSTSNSGYVRHFMSLYI